MLRRRSLNKFVCSLLACFLAIATVALGAAAKRDQFPSPGGSRHLAKSVKMTQSRAEREGISIDVGHHLRAAVGAIPNRGITPSLYQTPSSLVAIELRSPPLLV